LQMATQSPIRLRATFAVRLY